jgi:hypothetical protein
VVAADAGVPAAGLAGASRGVRTGVAGASSEVMASESGWETPVICARRGAEVRRKATVMMRIFMSKSSLTA